MENPLKNYILSAIQHLADSHDIEGIANLVAEATSNPEGRVMRYGTRVRVLGWPTYEKDKDEVHDTIAQVEGDTTGCYSSRAQASLFLEAAIAEFFLDRDIEGEIKLVERYDLGGERNSYEDKAQERGDVWFVMTAKDDGSVYEGRASVVTYPLVFKRELT